MTTIRKTYTTEFKVKVVREILREEKSLSQIASECGTHTNVISRWSRPSLPICWRTSRRARPIMCGASTCAVSVPMKFLRKAGEVESNNL
jgi:transposase-like protein